jgi:hypothetical protein
MDEIQERVASMGLSDPAKPSEPQPKVVEEPERESEVQHVPAAPTVTIDPPQICVSEGEDWDDCDVPAKPSVNVPSISLPEDEPEIKVAPTPTTAARTADAPRKDVTESSNAQVEERPNQPTMASLSSSLVCAGCSLPIAGRILSAMKLRWHPECFVCSHEECDEKLEHIEFHEAKGKPWCHFHYHEVCCHGHSLSLSSFLFTRVSFLGIFFAMLSVQDSDRGQHLHHHRRSELGPSSVPRASLFLRRMRRPVHRSEVSPSQLDDLWADDYAARGRSRRDPSSGVETVCGSPGSRLLRKLPRQSEKAEVWSV